MMLVNTGFLRRYVAVLANIDTDGLADGIGDDDFFDEFIGDGLMPDGLAHKITLTSGDDLSGIGFTLTGLDADGNTISELISTGPDSGSPQESVLFYKHLLSIATSVAVGENDDFDVGWADEAVSETLPLNFRAGADARHMLDVIGTVNVTVQFSIADPALFAHQAENFWVAPYADLTAETTDSSDVVDSKAGHCACRVKVNSYSDGAAVKLYTSQPD